MQYTINLTAGQELRAQISGKTLALLSTGVASSIDLKLEITGFAIEELRSQKRGFKVRTPGFDGVRFKSSVDAQIEVFSSMADIDLSLEGQTVSATITNTPLAVVPDRGAPANPVYVSGITYSDSPATSMVNTGPVPITSTATAVIAASATRKAARFTNVGTDDVTIGAAGITWAKRCIVLSAGDTWVEERGANLAWFAICDASKTASINVQEVLA
jgi:hypothetical protein